MKSPQQRNRWHARKSRSRFAFHRSPFHLVAPLFSLLPHVRSRALALFGTLRHGSRFLATSPASRRRTPLNTRSDLRKHALLSSYVPRIETIPPFYSVALPRTDPTQSDSIRPSNFIFLRPRNAIAANHRASRRFLCAAKVGSLSPSQGRELGRGGTGDPN